MPFDRDAALPALLSFIQREFNLDSVDPDEPLFSAGLIDSFSLVQVAAFIGDELGVVIPTKDLTVARMDRPRQMIETAARHAR